MRATNEGQTPSQTNGQRSEVMKSWKRKLEALGAAVAFAESGLWDTAEEILRDKPQQRNYRRDGKRSRTQQRPRARAYRA